MEAVQLGRRRFLGAAGITAVVTAAGGMGAVIVGGRGAWAVETKVLSADQAKALLQMARLIFPHDQFADLYYAAAVEQMDLRAAAEPAFKQQLEEGLELLDSNMTIPFVELSAGNQLTLLEEIDETPFFQDVRAHTLAALYSNEVIARRFGYEGSSVEYGGYLTRGFNDAGWLPDLPDQG